MHLGVFLVIVVGSPVTRCLTAAAIVIDAFVVTAAVVVKNFLAQDTQNYP